MKKYFIILITLFIMSSCSFFHMTPLKITSFTPSAGYHSDPQDITISVIFSSAPDVISVEQSFSFRKDGNVQEGQYSWDEKVLNFTPFEDFSQGHDYSLHISVEAEDEWGNSLNEDFYVSFTTKADLIRPEVTTVSPADEAVLTDQDSHVTAVFSEAVDPSSFHSAFSLSPYVRGYFNWIDDRNVEFIPLEPLRWNVDYTISISTSLEDLQGNTLAEDFSSTFTISVDDQAPEILSVQYTDETPVTADMAAWDITIPGVEITGNCSRDGSYLINFDADANVNKTSAESSITFVPSLNYEITWPSETQMKISPDPDDIVWNANYQLQISDGIEDIYGNTNEDSAVYHFIPNHTESKPPEVTAAYIQTSFPALPVDTPDYTLIEQASPINFSNYGNSGLEGYVDFYITPGDGHTLNYKTAVKAFMFSPTNSCVSFEINRIQIYSFSDIFTPNTTPAVSILEGTQMIRVFTTIEDETNSGLVKFIVHAGLEDSGGNIMPEQFSITAEK